MSLPDRSEDERCAPASPAGTPCPKCSGTGQVLLRYHRSDPGQPGECRHCKGRGSDPCCIHPSNHYSTTPGPVAADWSLVSLVPCERERGRAWPACQVRCAREMFDWCGQPGRWWFGQQRVCNEHAEALRRGDALYGLYPDGRWCTATRLYSCVRTEGCIDHAVFGKPHKGHCTVPPPAALLPVPEEAR